MRTGSPSGGPQQTGAGRRALSACFGSGARPPPPAQTAADDVDRGICVVGVGADALDHARTILDDQTTSVYHIQLRS